MEAFPERSNIALRSLVLTLQFELSKSRRNEYWCIGIKVDHTTIYRWVIELAPEIDKRSRPYLNPTNNSWKVDETYIKVKGTWKYLYRVVDSEGNTLDFILSTKRDAKAAKRFFKKVLKAKHNRQQASNQCG